MNIIKCCKGCTERRAEPINCHSTCERYLKEKKEYNRVKELLKKDSVSWFQIVKSTEKRSVL